MLLTALSLDLVAYERRTEAVATALQRLLRWFLVRFAVLQDLLLSWPAFQRLLLFAWRRPHAALLQQALKQPPVQQQPWESLDYWVDPQSRQTLQFAALHALSAHLQSDEVLAPAQLLPQVSRVLLQTEEANPGKYLEAVAAALASQMGAGLLAVDAMLLASLASSMFAAPPEAYLAAFSGTGGGSGGGGKAAKKLALAWLALREGLFSLERPTVVFIRNAEQLLCSSYDAHEAFTSAWNQEMLALEGSASRAPLVMLAGVCVNESAAALAGVKPQKQAWPSGGGEEDEDAEGALRPKSGRGGSRGGGGLFGGGSGSLDADLEDELGLGDLLLSLSRLAGESQRPNSRRLLLKVFPTRVKLQPPPAGPLAVRHQQRMQRDADEEAEEENYRAASAIAASTGVAIPPKGSGVYGTSSGKALSRADWGKVLSWAVTITTLQARQAQAEEERRREEAEEAAQAAAVAAAVQAAAAPGSSEADGEEIRPAGSPQPGTPFATGLRRRFGGGSSPAADAGQAPASRQRRQPGAPLALAAGAWQALNPLHLAGAAARLPWRAAQAAGSVARWGLYRLPLVGPLLESLLEGDLSEEDMEAELRELEAELEQLEQRSAASGGGSGGSLGGGGRSLGGGGALRLSELALQYGLGMLQRSSGSPKQAIEPSNSYERTLLAEVLAPEDCGRGFSEVGALGDAKAALREAVQLPLSHPELFASGALARPSKGVLLFGPPGTGKTLVARAAAAECGAAFLSLNPSAVASKWFGDSVKYIRAAFTLAAKLSPCVVFIDEVDALLGRRNSKNEHEALREMKNEFMSQWDGIRPGGSRIVVLGATNRPFDLDEAVLRRFTHRIFLGLPDRAARAAILQVILDGERLDAGVDVSKLAEQTEGYSGSDLKQLCVQAAMRPVRTLLEQDSATAAAAAAAAAVQEAEQAAAAAAAADSSEPAAPSSASQDGEAGGPGSVASGGSEPAPALLAAEPEVEPQPRGGALVPRLDSLLRQAEKIAHAPHHAKVSLRPISMQDFEEALHEISASVDPESATVQELNEWNRQYGTSGNKVGVKSKRLSYYS